MNKQQGIEEIKWEEILCQWLDLVEIYEPMLMKPIEVKKIHVNYNNKNCFFHGYDWINKKEYQKRVVYVSENPADFLYFGSSLNKGTLHTLEMLDKAREYQEDRAAIWITAFTKDILESMPLEWRGRGYQVLHKVYLESLCKINQSENYYIWHHAMRKLLPEICFSYDFLDNMNVNSYRQIIELSVISSAQVLNNYIGVEYDSRAI